MCHLLAFAVAFHSDKTSTVRKCNFWDHSDRNWCEYSHANIAVEFHLYHYRLNSLSLVLQLLTELTGLELDVTRVTGTIPTELGQLVDLIQFFAFDSFVTGVIPTEIGVSSPVFISSEGWREFGSSQLFSLVSTEMDGFGHLRGAQHPTAGDHPRATLEFDMDGIAQGLQHKSGWNHFYQTWAAQLSECTRA